MLEDQVANALVGALFGLSLILTITSGLTYARLRHLKLLFVVIAFALFLVEAVILVAARFDPSLWARLGLPAELLVLHLLVLVFLYLAVAKR